MTTIREALERIAEHLSSDWPERCQENVRLARAALAAQPAAEPVPTTGTPHVRIEGDFPAHWKDE